LAVLTRGTSRGCRSLAMRNARAIAVPPSVGIMPGSFCNDSSGICKKSSWGGIVSSNDSADRLVTQLREGDRKAGDEVYHRYAQQLLALAEKKIGCRLRRKIDPEDVVHSALASFFWRAADGQYQVNHSGALWRLLVVIMLNKIRRRAGKRDVRFENDSDLLPPDAIAHDPTAEEAAVLCDELDAVLSGAGSVGAEMVQLCLQGHTTGEIADRLKCSRWTVRRELDRIGARLRKRFEEEAAR
jgi:RNA polymerase sigma factor (sigma-70 family)